MKSRQVLMNYSGLLQNQTGICVNPSGASDVVSLIGQMDTASCTLYITTVFSSILIRKGDQKQFEFTDNGIKFWSCLKAILPCLPSII